MTYTITEQDPLLGRIEHTITTCRACGGTGEDWYPGCDDRAADCRSCDGIGETATSRHIHFTELENGR